MRDLAAQFEIKSDRNKSNWCKAMCIDEGKNFCPFDSLSKGLCCDKGDKCAPANADPFCSESNPKAPFSFKYFTCPNEDQCGDRYLYPYDSIGVPEKVRRSPDTKNFDFKKDDVCSYVVQGPATMGQYDRMHITITNIKKAEVWIS